MNALYGIPVLVSEHVAPGEVLAVSVVQDPESDRYRLRAAKIVDVRAPREEL